MQPVDVTLPFTDLTRLRMAAIQQALQTTRGHKGRAARLLGVHANTLTRMLAQIEAESILAGDNFGRNNLAGEFGGPSRRRGKKPR